MSSNDPIHFGVVGFFFSWFRFMDAFSPFSSRLLLDDADSSGTLVVVAGSLALGDRIIRVVRRKFGVPNSLHATGNSCVLATINQ